MPSLRKMLGLRGSSGRSHASKEAGKRTPEPTNLQNGNSKGEVRNEISSAVDSPLAIQPPASVGDSIQVAKRFTVGRRSNVIRAASGQHSSINVVRDQYASVRHRCQRELGANVGIYAFDTSHSGLVDWIKHERMARLPHKGGSWDRVLISAAYFAGQVNRLGEAIESFTPETEAASNLLYGQCLTLLELGYENATALQTAFDLFYQLGLELSPLLRAENALRLAPSIMEGVARAFSELLAIVSGITISYYSAVHGSRQSTRLDIYALFGSSIANYRSKVQHCEHEIWNFELRTQGYGETIQIETLQEWLAPQDKVLAFLSSNHISLTSRPEDYTCIWFQSHLNQFFKQEEKVLLIEGPSGSGKTTLANWVVNRLQRPIGGRVVPILNFFYNSSISAQATCLSMLKTLLFQLLSLRIGDLDLFIIVFQAFTESKSLSSTAAQEERLWEALRQALSNSSADEEIALIIDGLDEMEGLKPAGKKVSEKLQAIAQDVSHLRLLLFSQPLGVHAAKSMEIVELSLDNIYDDLHIIIQQGLSRNPHFVERDAAEKSSIVDNLLTITDGSLLLANLLVTYLAQYKTPVDFGKGYEALVKAPPKTVSELVQKLLGTAKLDNDSKTVISILSAAKRPLFISELEALLRVDPKGVGSGRPVPLGQITDSISAFTVTAEGLITLRHEVIKQAFLNIPDNSDVSLHLKDRHKDLLIRLLGIATKQVRDMDEPRLDLLPSSDVDKRISSHYLLEYTIRYWAIHFKLSSLYKVQGDLQLPPEFASVFPSSVSFALLEANRWVTQYLHDEVVELFTIAYRVRKQLFGLEHPTVLQSAITIATYYETVLSRYPDAVEWYALVVRIGKTVLGLQSELVVTCCNTLLHISETLVTTKRTTIMTYREEILQILISSYTHQYGATSTEVLKVYEALSKLYISIKEETKVKEIQIKIREITTGSHEEHGSHDGDIGRHLDVMLKKRTHEEEVEGFDSLLFGYEEETEETWSITHVENMIKFVLELVKLGRFSNAEEIYVELWLKLSDHCQSTSVVEWHEKRIEVMLQYASFLHTQKRDEEASAVLISCWNEYSAHQVSMFESIILLMKEIAVCMKTVNLTSLSLTVFQQCWSWFKSTHKEESSVFKEIVEHIATTSSVLVKKSSETTTTTTTTTASESVIREVFESSFSSEETEVTTTTMELSTSLTSMYIEQEQWSDAVSVIQTTLKRTWASFFAESIESVSLDASFSSESVQLVLDLAKAYINQKRYEKVEQLYLRLYRVHRKARKFDDVDVVKFRKLYIEFLTKYELTSVLISFYQELLVEYRSFYGPDHIETITILYALGDICRSHHLTHGYWIEYYSEIIVTLNKGARICHENALRALIVVAEYYYDLQRYSESLDYLKSIIATFCQFGTKYKVFQDTVFVQKTLERYYRVIEETQVDIQEHVTIMKEIRAACVKYFGESSEVSINVTVSLAEVCTKSERYQYEAIAYYDSVLKHASSKTVSTTIVKRSKHTLRSLYMKQVTESSSSSTETTKVTKETLEKATAMTYERYTEIRKSYSATHETTLSTLKELVVLYHKQQKTEQAIKELHSLTLDSVLSTSSTKAMIETARFLASVFSEYYVSQGVQLVRELKMQVIYKQISKSAGFDVTKAGRGCFAFIASFEYYLRARAGGGSVAGYMAEILAEFLFYERLVSSIKMKAKIGVVILLGARLRQIHFRSGRAEDFEFVERQVLEYFTTTETRVVEKSSNKSSIRGFVRILLGYFSERNQPKDFVASAARAAVAELKAYVSNQKYKEALGLTQVVYGFLMAHEGLDDPTEITLGFQLCLMMAGRGAYKRTAPADEETNKAMLALSQTILGEVFDICNNNKIDLARCPLPELDELISLLGDQKDSPRLLWLLESLWEKRGTQNWGSDVKLRLGVRLVQARFLADDRQVVPALQLAEDIVYNLRRTHGPRHKQTLSVYELLASLYTSTGHFYAQKSTAENANALLKKRDATLARTYFKKAITANEDLLKLLVDTDVDDDEDDEDDQFSVASGSVRVRGSMYGLNRRIPSHPGLPPSLLPSKENTQNSGLAESEAGTGHHRHNYEAAPREVLVQVAGKHLRTAKLAVQRYGGWEKLVERRFDSLTTRVWRQFGEDLKMTDDLVLSSKWKVTGYPLGKAEAGLEEDGFHPPSNWAISA